MLRRRHHAQTKVVGEAEGRQETDEAGRERRDSAGSLPRGIEGRLMLNYFEWRRHRRAAKEAKLLIREAKRAIRKYSHRLTSKQLEDVRGAVNALVDSVKN